MVASFPKQTLARLAPSLRKNEYNATRQILAGSLKNPADWPGLAHLAGYHRLLGYLCYAVKDMKAAPDIAKDQARRTLEGQIFRYAHQNLALKEILEALCEQRILLVKGMSIAQKAHSPSYLRAIGDIDLLLPRSEISSTIEILMSRGFSLIEDPAFVWPLPPWMKNDQSVQIDEVSLHRDGVVVELHTNIVTYKLFSRVQFDQLWRGKSSIHFKESGVVGYTLNPVDSWIHLAINQCIHRFAHGLGGLLDLAKWEDVTHVSPETIKERTQEFGVDYLIQPTLALLKNVFPDLPSVRALAKDKAGDPMLFEKAKMGRNTHATYLRWIRSCPRPMHTLTRNIFPGRKQAAFMYRKHPQSPLLWLKRMSRPLELAWKHRQAIRRDVFS